MSYPNTVDSFTTKVDSQDTIQAAHMNAVQAAIVAIETELGTLPKGSAANLTARLSASLNTDGTLKSTAVATAATAASTSVAGVVVLSTDAETTAGEVVQATDTRLKRGSVLTLCASFTPAGTGADTAEIVVPYDPKDGTTSITWNVRRIDFRVQTAGGAPAITVEKSTGSGAFSATSVGTVTLGSGSFEGNATASLGTVASGNKLRFNVGTLASAQNWTIQVTLGQ